MSNPFTRGNFVISNIKCFTFYYLNIINGQVMFQLNKKTEE